MKNAQLQSWAFYFRRDVACNVLLYAASRDGGLA